MYIGIDGGIRSIGWGVGGSVREVRTRGKVVFSSTGAGAALTFEDGFGVFGFGSTSEIEKRCEWIKCELELYGMYILNESDTNIENEES